MPTILTVKCDDIFTGVGEVRHDYPAGTGVRPQRPFDKVTSYGVLLYWPKKDDWLRIEADVQPPPGAGPRAPFLPSREGVETICRLHGSDRARVAPDGLFAAMNVRVASLTVDKSVELSVFVDTGSEAFRALAREQGLARGITDPNSPRQVVYTVKVMLFDNKSIGVPFTQPADIELQLEPAYPVPAFNGVVALDLGNTSTAIACLSRHDPIYLTSSLRLLDAGAAKSTLKGDASPLSSIVRIDRVVSQTPAPKGVRSFPTMDLGDDDPRAIEFYAGRTGDVPGGGAAGLIPGPKRLVSGPESDQFREIMTRHQRGPGEPDTDERVLLQNRVPAELLACRTMEKFRSAARHWPAEIAVTYPVTYAPKEIDRLCEAVERGWLRMNNVPQRLGVAAPPDDPTLARLATDTQARLMHGGSNDAAPGAIRLRLDEATAASFFFLFRRIFETPGGLPAFRYLYPSGMTMLLYDLGGGTTDIALVKATSDNNRHLRIAVLGRTGLRGFGGDDMTRAIARLLKAKMLVELGRARGSNPPPPNPPAKTNDPVAARTSVEQFVAKAYAIPRAEEWVPTTFTPGQSDPDTVRRQRFAAELFRFAEEIKRELAKPGATSAKLAGGVLKNRDALAEPMFAGLPDVQMKAVEAQLQNLTIHRWEADAIIDAPDPRDPTQREGPIARSIRKCNGLIDVVLRQRPAEAERPEQEVDWVVVSGNAARYPLVRERLEADLQIDDVAGRLTLDEDNLKSAVAKGAAMYMMTTTTPGLQVVIETATQLSACLPFDVGYFDLSQGRHVNLYREHAEYAKLTPTDVPVESAGGDDKRTFFLERRFPGDDAYSQYKAFEFDRPPGKTLSVSYDNDAHEFKVTDAETGVEGVSTDLTDGSLYLTPPERGDV